MGGGLLVLVDVVEFGSARAFERHNVGFAGIAAEVAKVGDLKVVDIWTSQYPDSTALRPISLIS
jgi:hypothetical protein